jgi:hypothetical protein
MSEKINISLIGTFDDQLSRATVKAKSSLEALKKTTDEMVKSSNNVGSAGTKAASGFSKIQTAASTAATKVKAFATALPGVINGLSSVATSAVMLHRSYRDLVDTQIKVDRATRQLSLANEAEAKAQAKVNQLVAEGKQGTPEYAQALVDLEQAQQQVKIKTDLLGEAQEAQSDAYEDFYLSIIPGVLGILGTLSSTFVGLRAVTAATGTATIQLSTAMKALRVALIAIPLVAIAAALLAIKTNAFGFRDALNELGVKLGQIFPQIKPFLQWIKDLAEAFGLTEKAMDLKKAWDLLVSGFQGAIKKIKETDWKAVINTIVTGISDFIKNFDWDAAWQSFKDALKSFAEWLDPILKDIGKFITDTIKSEGPKWWAGFQEALYSTGQWVKTGMISIAKAILNYISTNKDKWWIAFQEALWNGGKWVLDALKNIGTTISEYIKGNAASWWNTLVNVGKQVLGAINPFNWLKGFGGVLQGAEAAGPGGGGGMVDLATAKNMMGIPTQPKIDITAAIAKLDQLKAYANTTTTQISSFFVVMESSIKATLGRIGTFGTTAFTPLQTAATTVTSQTSAAFVTMETSIKGTITRIGAVFPTAFTQLYTFALQNTGKTIEAFVILQQQITTVMTAIKTVIGTQFLAIIDIISAFGPVLTALQNQFSNFSTSVSTYMTGMTTAIGNFATKSTASFNTVNTAVKTTQNALSSMSTSVSTYMTGMSSKVSQFGSAAQSAFSKVKSSADAATKSVKALQSAINALKSKTITITVNFKVNKPSGLEHGGAFLASAQHGFSGIVDRPTTMGGVRMGEGFKPELVTVQPLTRGTGNHSGPTVSSGGFGGSSRPIEIHVHNEINGREIQRIIKRVALEDIGLQI